MNKLLEKYNDYHSLTKFIFSYILYDGTKINYAFTKTSFIHLLGLHKLVDIPIIGRFNDVNDKVVSSRYLISKIKQEKMLTDASVQASSYFNAIRVRYNSFSRNNIIDITYTDIIIDFNSKLIHSRLSAKYILYCNIKGVYHYLAIALGSNNSYYVESFFASSSDSYIKNQKTMKVKNFKILHDSGDIYLEDTF